MAIVWMNGGLIVSNKLESILSLRSALLMGAVFMAGSAMIATSAFAQTPPPAPAQQEEEEDEKKVEEKVTVTGSRIRRNEFTAPSPIQVITNEQSILRGQIDAADVLQQGSLAAGSQQINNQLTGFVAEGGPGVNTVSLRGLGATRTLVLLNGRRLSPAGTRGQVGAVDLNVLPQSVINRYEILKDGASSVYGSDAVAGVINGITVRNIDGGGINVSTALPFDGGAEVHRVDGVWGQRYDDGQFMIAGEYYRQEKQTVGDREITACNQDLIGNITDGVVNSTGAAYPASLNQLTAGVVGDIIDPATGKSKCFNQLHGVIDLLAGPGGRYVTDPAAVLGGGVFLLDRVGLKRVGLAIGNGAAGSTASGSPGTIGLTNQQKLDAWRVSQGIVPNDYPNFGSRTYISPVERYSLFAQGDVQISQAITAYGEFLYSRRESEQTSFRQLFPNVASTNPNNTTGFTARSIIAIPSDGSQEVSFYRAVAGLKGDLFSLSDYFMRDWSFDIYAQGTLSAAKYTNDIIYNDRVNAVTAAGVACNAALITISAAQPFGACPAGGVGWFRPNLVNSQGTFANFTQAERDFLFTKETGETSYEQFLIAGSIAGTLFDLPAGEVGAVLGFERRYDAIDDLPGFNARNNNLWGQTSAGRTQGSDNVVEAFGEIEIPLLADLPLFKAFTTSASIRFTNYDSYGSEDTYKLGFDWRLDEQYRIRGTTGISYRAPALFELFLANQTAFAGQANIDPCIQWNLSANPQIQQNCGPLGDNLPAGYTGPHSSALIVTGGGAGVLSAETSDAKTLGAVWTPSWLPISVAVDYFDIVVKNQVAQFGAANILAECYTDPVYNASPFCALFVRNLTPGVDFGKIETVNNSYVNLNEQDIKGLDVTFNFKQEIEELDGTLTIDFQGTWAFDQDINLFIGTTNDLNGDIYSNDFVGSLDARFDTGPWTLFYSSNMFSRASNNENFQDTIFGFRGLPECGTAAASNAFLQNVCIEAEYKQFAEWTMTHDVSVRWREDGWTAQLGVINVFDDLAPTTSSGAGTTRIGNSVSIANYDATGRRLFINLGYNF